MKFFLFSLLLLPSCFLFSATPSPSESQLRTLYNRTDPISLSKHLAFYELYKEYPIGNEALEHIAKLLEKECRLKKNESLLDYMLSNHLLDLFLDSINKPINQPLKLPSDEQLLAFKQISQVLPHTKLKGHGLWNESEILFLQPDEIDLARGLFVTQFGEDRRKITAYETILDLMAFQILLRLSPKASPEEKIRKINQLIFDEMGFRFPPHTVSSKEIDVYSYLPSVLDSRRGVCLGISLLYLCLAQRLNLDLEMITPPGHIYVRYRSKHKIINIETTARGVHVDSKEYHSINTCRLQQRNLKEVIGMIHFNQSSIFWQNGQCDKALESYEKAKPYLQEDVTLKELMGYCLVITGQQEEGSSLLREVASKTPEYTVSKGRVAEDYLNGLVDAESIKILFERCEEDRASLLKRKEKLEEILSRYPFFRLGIAALAEIWLKLHRHKEALEWVKRYLALDFTDPEMHYYAAQLYLSRNNYPKGWFHLKKAEEILKNRNHEADELKELRRELIKNGPEE